MEGLEPRHALEPAPWSARDTGRADGSGLAEGLRIEYHAIQATAGRLPFKGASMIKARALRVDYDEVTAVAEIDLDVAAGEVFGLIGPNGAGKTSTIRALAGVLEPTYGEIELMGVDARRHPE